MYVHNSLLFMRLQNCHFQSGVAKVPLSNKKFAIRLFTYMEIHPLKSW